MKRLLQLLFIILVPVIALSQSLQEKKAITKNYNIEKLEK